jgi:putative transposase
MFTITDLGINGELACCLASTNVIESPNSVVRRVSSRVTNCKGAEMTLRWSAAGLVEAEKSFNKLCAHVELRILINSLRPAPNNSKEQHNLYCHRLKSATEFGMLPQCMQL